VVERRVGALFSCQKKLRIIKLLTIFAARKATSEDTTALFWAEIPKKAVLSSCVSEIIVFLQPY